jgi:uncharacterized integral membrane protein
MAEESPLYRKQEWRAKWRWSMLSGLALGVLFAVWFYFVLENQSLSFFLDQWWPVAILAYALLVMLLFFTIGLLWGRQQEIQMTVRRLLSWLPLFKCR